jgi:hypothetical protein
MKEIKVKREGNFLVYYNRNNRKMCVMDETNYSFWIAPFDKKWQTKKYSKQEYQLVIEPTSENNTGTQSQSI